MRVLLFLSSGLSNTLSRLNIMGTLLQDLRYAFRQLLKNPEHGGVRADAEREREHGHGGESGIL